MESLLAELEIYCITEGQEQERELQNKLELGGTSLDICTRKQT
jgi:hypothetical protein